MTGRRLSPLNLGPRPASKPDPKPANNTIHIALVVQDHKQWTAIKESSFVITTEAHVSLVLHVLLQHPKQTREEMVIRFAAVQLGMTTAEAAQLTYPDQIDLGMKDAE